MWGEFLLAHAGHLLAMGGLLVFSGFFSGTETATFSLSRGQLVRMEHAGPTGRRVCRLLRRPARLLNSILLGNMIVNIAYAGTAAVLVLDLQQAGGSAVEMTATSLTGLLGLILLGEVTPKMIAFSVPESWSLVAAYPMGLLCRIFSPVIWVLDQLLVSPLTKMIAPVRDGSDTITSDELASLMSLSARRGIVRHDAGGMLQEIVHLADLRASDIMVPRVDMIAYDVDAGSQGLIELFRQTRLRKIPVYRGDVDNILGVVHFKRVALDPDRPLDRMVRKVPYVPEAASAERLLMQFRVRKAQLAIVVDEYGGTAGLVALEDVLEEIVGDIPDAEGDQPPPPVEQLGDNDYRIDGALPIHEWSEAFGEDLAAKRISTIGGFVTSLLGRLPREGDVVSYRNLTFTVEAARGRRIERMRLRLRPPEDTRTDPHASEGDR